MPLRMREALQAFVQEHHVDTAFVKRKRDEADPEALARRAPISKGNADE
jgi:HPt (histidine-containing phosphotransfer) domain-containing protein